MRKLRKTLLVSSITLILLELLTRLWFGGLAAALTTEALTFDSNLFPDGLYTANRTLTPDYSGIAPTGIIYNTNAYGLRDDPIDREKPLWLFLGDSTTFGLNIAHEDTYPEQVEQLVPGIQAVNAAVPGWGTAEELDTLNALLTDGLHFDVVCIGFFANDARNVALYDMRRDKPPTVFDQLALVQLVSGLVEQVRVQSVLNQDWRTAAQQADLWIQPDWRLTRDYLDSLIATAQASGARVILLYIPFDENEVWNGSAVDVGLTAYAETTHLPYISGVTVYREYLEGHGLTAIPASFYSHGADMAHPSVLTSRLLAQAITMRLQTD